MKKLIPLILSATALLLGSCGGEEPIQSESIDSSIESLVSSTDISAINEKKNKVATLKKNLIDESSRETKGHTLTQNKNGNHFASLGLLFGTKDAEELGPVSVSIDVKDKITSLSHETATGRESLIQCENIDFIPQFGAVEVGATRNQSPVFYADSSAIYGDFTNAPGIVTMVSLVSKSIGEQASELPTKAKFDLEGYNIDTTEDLEIAIPLINAFAEIMDKDAELDESIFKYSASTDGTYSITYSPTKEQMKKFINSFIEDKFGKSPNVRTFIDALFLVIPEDRNYYRSDFSFVFSDDELKSINVDFRLKSDENSVSSLPLLSDLLPSDLLGGARFTISGLEASFVYTPIPEEEAVFSLPDDLADYVPFSVANTDE